MNTPTKIQNVTRNLRPRREDVIKPPVPLPPPDAAALAKKARRAGHESVYSATANMIAEVKAYRSTIALEFTDEIKAEIGESDAAKVQAVLDGSKKFLNSIIPGTVV